MIISAIVASAVLIKSAVDSSNMNKEAKAMTEEYRKETDELMEGLGEKYGLGSDNPPTGGPDPEATADMRMS